MVRKTLLSLTLIGVIVMPDIGSAQAGNYDLTGVHNIYHYLVRDMDSSVGDSLDGTYQVKASWPNAYNSLFDFTLSTDEVVILSVWLLSPCLPRRIFRAFLLVRLRSM